ncbi:MAG TPA: ATP-binding protein [Bacteroidales bacterium]|nr:ATP-binding protein [Bacteroidales bacterium]
MEKEAEKQLIKVAITGPESTGKSWLAEHLAAHYGTIWVNEYAREYLEQLQRPYTFNDILTIAKGQLKAENEAAQSLPLQSLIFCDTEFIVTKIWCNVKYGRSHSLINRLVKNHRYDLYLLCDIDMPWEFDPLREHPQQREFLFDLYIKELRENHLPFKVISGSGNKRLENAIQAVEELLSGEKSHQRFS